MYDAAHGVVPTHEIFHKPLKVNLQFEDYPTPLDYYRYPRTKTPREPIKAWRVQSKKYPEIDPGLVSSRERFINTPDAEIIGGGINGKGPQSVAIGRHANFFLWGFSAQPSDMTPDGRKCFVNAICYIKKFEGHKAQPAQYASSTGRERILKHAYYLRSISDVYIEGLVKKFNEKKSEYPPEALKRFGDDPAAYYRKLFMPSVESRLKYFPKELREQFGLDSEKYIRYYEDNLEYLRPSGVRGYVVDEEVKALGISNRRIKLLKYCVTMLEKKTRQQLARRILERYTGQQFPTATQWRDWLNSNEERLVFSEERGFKFVVDRGNGSSLAR